MKRSKMKTQISSTGFKVWLSANDTYNWAHKAGASWPGSELSGKRLFAEYDSNGLCDLAIDGSSDSDCSSTELGAIVSDVMAGKLPANHPSACALGCA